MTYTRFVTERDELVHNDCVFCSKLMTIGWGTNDLIYRKADGTDMTAVEVKALRERIRSRSGDLTGGASVEEAVKGAEAVLPYLDLWCSHIPLATVETRLRAGWAGVLIGNPIGVTNTKSKLRRWTNNDDFGHAVKGGPFHSDGVNLYIQDPMGFGTYEGDWVPWAEVKQFMRPMRQADSTYHTMLIQRGALLSTTITVDRSAQPRTFAVPKGNRKIGYLLNPASGRLELEVDQVLAVPLSGTCHLVEVRQYPASQKPVGSCIQVVKASDARYNGTVLSLAAVTVAGAAPGIDEKSIRAAGFIAGRAAALTALEHASPAAIGQIRAEVASIQPPA